ncbi:MAG: ATP-dependent protease LonB, partial [Nanoarchaeota archaeon]|nr:ATP-dependent protease LonB [Nanoarchaeota archaeon]
MKTNPTANAIIYSASMVTGMVFVFGFVFMMNFGKKMENKTLSPKVIVDNFGKKQVPFLDATGAHAGALLGDVLHDPFQSGGLGTPSHERVIAGMIHKAHMGVLFIDEIATLQPTTQQDLLTSLQEGKYAITGQSERSAGAMVRTEPVPCTYVLVAAGNVDTIKNMHPALRSRIRGYGYEVYMETTMPDTPENREKIAVFVAQEIKRDGKIPHFNKDAVDQIIEEARIRADRKNHLTLRLRELGGVVRAAGDLAKAEGKDLVTSDHVLRAKQIARTLERQIVDKMIDYKKEYNVIRTSGTQVGRVNGLSVMGASPPFAGEMIPIEAEVVPGNDKTGVYATGGLQEIAKESVTNVSALVKRYFGEDLRGKYDIYIQFLNVHGLEGDSASIAMATAIISALKQVPVKQDIAMTGSLSVRGEVLAVGGVTGKVEAAIDAGIKTVILPATNLKDIIIPKERLSKIKIIPVENIKEVLEEALEWSGKEKILEMIKSKNR